mmetsp:Transcript_73973/g.214270  ORF Transcript_73973/g.214270 Transcript_73973/m.214270 type:complete len:202 (-) Transcript_73973:568-1173(-)
MRSMSLPNAFDSSQSLRENWCVRASTTWQPCSRKDFASCLEALIVSRWPTSSLSLNIVSRTSYAAPNMQTFDDNSLSPQSGVNGTVFTRFFCVCSNSWPSLLSRFTFSHGNLDSPKRSSIFGTPKSNSWLPREAASKDKEFRMSIICFPSKRLLRADGESRSPAKTTKVRSGFRLRSCSITYAARDMPPFRTPPLRTPETS